MIVVTNIIVHCNNTNTKQAALATMALALTVANLGIIPFESPICTFLRNHHDYATLITVQIYTKLSIYLYLFFFILLQMP